MYHKVEYKKEDFPENKEENIILEYCEGVKFVLKDFNGFVDDLGVERNFERFLELREMYLRFSKHQDLVFTQLSMLKNFEEKLKLTKEEIIVLEKTLQIIKDVRTEMEKINDMFKRENKEYVNEKYVNVL
jgi:hypothetical protein